MEIAAACLYGIIDGVKIYERRAENIQQNDRPFKEAACQQGVFGQFISFHGNLHRVVFCRGIRETCQYLHIKNTAGIRGKLQRSCNQL